MTLQKDQTQLQGGNNLRKRDLIIGYVDQLRQYGYPEERLVPCPMIVNTDIFHPRELTEEQKKKYGCDVMFASNRGKPTEDIVTEDLLPPLEPLGFSRQLLMAIHDELWQEYRSEKTVITDKALKTVLFRILNFQCVFENLSPDDQDNVLQRIFWRLNDTIYRYVILEWLDELGVDLHLHGNEWSRHPRFRKFDRGPIAHGKELAIAYQAATYCLHLNCGEYQHQGLLEIPSSGGNLLKRISRTSTSPVLASAFRKIVFNKGEDLAKHERNEVSTCLFNLSLSLPNAKATHLKEASHRLAQAFEDRLFGFPDWVSEDWHPTFFQSRSDLEKVFTPHAPKKTCNSGSAHAFTLLNGGIPNTLKIKDALFSLLDYGERENTLSNFTDSSMSGLQHLIVSISCIANAMKLLKSGKAQRDDPLIMRAVDSCASTSKVAVSPRLQFLAVLAEKGMYSAADAVRRQIPINEVESAYDRRWYLHSLLIESFSKYQLFNANAAWLSPQEEYLFAEPLHEKFPEQCKELIASLTPNHFSDNAILLRFLQLSVIRYGLVERFGDAVQALNDRLCGDFQYDVLKAFWLFLSGKYPQESPFSAVNSSDRRNASLSVGYDAEFRLALGQLKAVENIINEHSTSGLADPSFKADFLFLSARLYRAQNRMNECVACFNESSSLTNRWLPLFEHARTLRGLGRLREAGMIASKASAQQLGNSCNLCPLLLDSIHDLNNPDIKSRADQAIPLILEKLQLLPVYYSQRLWLISYAISLDFARGDRAHAYSLLCDLMREERIVDREKINELADAIKADKNFSLEKCLSGICSSLYPTLPPNSFERTLLVKEFSSFASR